MNKELLIIKKEDILYVNKSNIAVKSRFRSLTMQSYEYFQG